MIFQDRADAGRKLAIKLQKYADQPDAIVLAIPRGGVPVGYEVARLLKLPLDVFLVRKLGVPAQEELAMGAIASDGVRVTNEDIVRELGISQHQIDIVAANELVELRRREAAYRNGRPAPVVRDKTVILVDDGLATGASMRAALAALRRLSPSRIVIAVPVGAPQTCAEFLGSAEEVVCLNKPASFHAVGAWYRDFSQTTDEEVRKLLEMADGFRTPTA